MSVWTTKSTGRAREFIVLRHSLRGVNYIVNGVRFRNSYAVVEKNSKIHRTLKQIPVLKSSQEFPLLFLRDLPFITRPLDVKTVYGAEVYFHYIKELEKTLVKEAEEKKVEQEIKHISEDKKCAYRTDNSGGQELCKSDALDESPSGYCIRHVLKDPKLKELGFEISEFIPKKDKKHLAEKTAESLRKLKKEGKF